MHSIKNLDSNVSFHVKMNETKNTIPNVTNLAITITALNAAENKIPDHSKYITTPEINKLTPENVTARSKCSN